MSEVLWQITVPVVSTGLFSTLALVASIIVTSNIASKQIDDLSKRIDDLRSDLTSRLDKIDTRLERIEAKLTEHGDRILKLEERAVTWFLWPTGRRKASA